MKRRITKQENKTQEKQVMQMKNNCSPPTDPQPVPEQRPPPAVPPVHIPSIMSYGVGYPFGQLGSAVPAMSPPSFLCTPSPLAGGVV